MALREAVAVLVGQHPMVMINRLGQAEQRLQETVHMCGRQQILPACDQRHSLKRIVEGSGEVIAGGRILAPQDDIAEESWVDFDPAMSTIDESERSRPSIGLGRIEAQRVGLSRGDPLRTFDRGTPPAGARIDAMLDPVRRPPRRGDLGACAEAGIEKALRLQAPQGRRIVGEVVGLAAHRPLPIEPEPGQILVDADLELYPGAGAVDILDA